MHETETVSINTPLAAPVGEAPSDRFTPINGPVPMGMIMRPEVKPNPESAEAVSDSAKAIGAEVDTLHWYTALHIYRVGFLCVEERKRTKKRNFTAHKSSGLNMVDLRRAIRLVKKYETEAAFTQAWKEWHHPTTKTFHSFCRTHLPHNVKRNRKEQSMPEEKLLEKLVTRIGELKTDPERMPKLAVSMNNIRRVINRAVPPLEDLADTNYIKYYACACCGAYPPPPDGYEERLFNTGLFQMRYPICETCIAEEKEPDWQRVAVMYASYALNLEYATDVIQESLE